MGERTQEMASTSAHARSATATLPPAAPEEPPVERVAVITLRPTHTQSKKKVVWAEDTVDNEDMNKKKSKCCCIYEKPRQFGESDSEDSDDECEHCFGHVERKKMKQHLRQHHGESSTIQEELPREETATVVLRSAVEPYDPPSPAEEMVEGKDPSAHEPPDKMDEGDDVMGKE